MKQRKKKEGIMSSVCNNKIIWLDGKYIPYDEAKTHLLTHTLHYGAGVFEGVRAYETEDGPAIFRLKEHTDRLFRSAKIIDMKIPFSKEEINEAQIEILKRNSLKSAYLRPMVFYGSEYLGLGTRNLSVHVMIAAWEWGAYLGEENMIKGIKVCTSSFSRNHVNSSFCKAKANGNYLNSILALKEAQANGCEEALLLDHQGCVAEGSGENIFMIRDGILITPDLTSILEGITRDAIIKLAQDLGIKTIERRITRDELYVADEAFFTGTAAEVTPIRIIDNREIGSGTRGPITEMLQSAYAEIVRGKRKEYEKWLSRAQVLTASQ
jgi:branched-chain amino acid aminotransferase